MSKILIVNASRDFSNRMSDIFATARIPSSRIRSRDSFLSVSKNGLIEFFYKNEKIELEDSKVFVRLSGHDAHLISLLVKICLEKNIPVNDRVCAEHTSSQEKISQMILLALKDIPIPSSILCSSESFISNRETILRLISFPCVVKKDGSQGKFVWKVSSEELLLKLLFKYNELMLIQEYIPNTYDIRTIIYNGEILGSIKRSSTDSFYNNVARGGMVSDIELTKEEEEVARKACEACCITFGGVDIVRSESGPLILEVNQGPQIKGFEGHTRVNVPAEIAKRMLEE